MPSGTESYEVNTFEDIQIAKSTPISPMPLPEEDSAENMLIKIEGNSTTLNMSWRLTPFTNNYGVGHSESSDVTPIVWDATLKRYRPAREYGSDGTKNNLAVKSVFEQVAFLESFMPKSISDEYAVHIYDTESQSTQGNKAIYEKSGLFQGVNFRTDSGSPVNWMASTDFIEGSVISTLSSNTQQAPINVTGAFYSAGSPPLVLGFTVTFSEYPNYASGDRPETTGAVLRYKQSGRGFWQENEISFSKNPNAPYNYTKQFIISNIDNTKYYECKLALVTSGGRGLWSAQFTVNP